MSSGKAPPDPTSAEGSVDYDIITGKKKWMGTGENVDSLGNTMLGNEVKERFGSTRAAFLKMDSNRDGRITVNEVRQLCRQWNIPQSEAERVLAAADLDSNGTMDYNEFARRFDPDYYRRLDEEPVDMASSSAIGAIYDDRPIASSGWAKFDDDQPYTEMQAQSATKIQAAARGKHVRTKSGRLVKDSSGGVGRSSGGVGRPVPRAMSGTGGAIEEEAMGTPAGSGSRAARSIKTEQLEQENGELKARVAELEKENEELRKALAASQKREAELTERAERAEKIADSAAAAAQAAADAAAAARSAGSGGGIGRSTGSSSPTPRSPSAKGLSNSASGGLGGNAKAKEKPAVKSASVRFEDEEEAIEEEEPLQDVVVYGQQDDKKTQAVMAELRKNGVKFDAFDFNSTKDYMSALKASGFPENRKVVPPVVVVKGKLAFWDEPGGEIAVHFPTMLTNELRKLGLVAAAVEMKVAPRNVTMDVEIQERFYNMQEAFLTMDDDRDGVISREELRRLCTSWNIPQSEAERVIKEADFDANGNLDFREFCRRFGR